LLVDSVESMMIHGLANPKVCFLLYGEADALLRFITCAVLCQVVSIVLCHMILSDRWWRH